MWDEIEDYFKNYPAQKRVALFLLRKGFQVSTNGRIICGGMLIPHTQIGKELGIDRRVVDTTAKRILENERLKRIYEKLQSIAFLREAAPDLELSVIVITPKDASKPGIIGSVASKIAKHGISIRQAIADDPYLTENPEFTVITDSEVSGELLNELKKIEGIKKITIY
jgi:hypothetical protein